MVFYSILGLIAIFAAVILVRAFRFTPPVEKEVSTAEISLNTDNLVSNFSKMLKCKTISNYNKELIDWEEFLKFKSLLVELYPNVHRVCKKEEIGETGLLY
jgi:carboxypeptidase PM20D1